MTNREIKELIKIMRVNGVTSLKTDGVELTLSLEALFPKRAKRGSRTSVVDNTQSIPAPAWQGMSDEQLATWSSRSPDEIGEQ